MSEQLSTIPIRLHQARWWAPTANWLLAHWRGSRRWHLAPEIVALSDHMLLDIGIDPRSVPNPLADEIGRPDLALSGRVPPRWRTTARS